MRSLAARARRLAKHGLAGAWRFGGGGALYRALGGRHRPFIVAYHHVVEDYDASAALSLQPMLTSTGTFARHLDWLARRFDLVSLETLAERLAIGPCFRRPTAAITFDDGYADVYEQAFPILRGRGIPAAVFVVTGLIGTRRLPMHDRLHLALRTAANAGRDPSTILDGILAQAGVEARPARPAPGAASAAHDLLRFLLERLGQEELERVAAALEAEIPASRDARARHLPMTWEMLAAMQRAGVTIGSHSRTHPLLTRVDPDRVRHEITESRRDLRDRLGVAADHFAYPNGWYDAAAVNAVRAAGYRCAYTSCQHQREDAPLLTLPRTLLWEKSGIGATGGFSPTLMRALADGLFERDAACRMAHAF